MNILSNAFKFTPPQGSIRCTLRREGDQAVVEVADSGPGVAPEHRAHIFGRFRQLDGGADRRFGGTGLGLAIVKDLVELHGGNVEVSDAPEGGALLVVRLPTSAPEGSQVERARWQALDAAPPISVAATAIDREDLDDTAAADAPLVLVVEDNPDLNLFICRCLADDYRVAATLNGQSALVEATTLRPDLVITDVMMPGMTGEELVRRLRLEPQLAGLPIVVLTAKLDDEMRVRVLEAGANDFVLKPFSVNELLARVGNLVRDHLDRKQFEQLSLVDPLTGVLNRRGWDQALHRHERTVARRHRLRAHHRHRPLQTGQRRCRPRRR